MNRLQSAVVMMLPAVLFACGGAGPPREERLSTVAVSGTVSYKGQALENYRVMFLPVEGNRAANGLSDASGKFTLGTNEPGDGCPVGKYKVAVAFDPPIQGDPSIQAGIEDPAKMPKPKIKIPAKYADPDKSGLTQEVTGSIADLKLDLQ